MLLKVNFFHVCLWPHSWKKCAVFLCVCATNNNTSDNELYSSGLKRAPTSHCFWKQSALECILNTWPPECRTVTSFSLYHTRPTLARWWKASDCSGPIASVEQRLQPCAPEEFIPRLSWNYASKPTLLRAVHATAPLSPVRGTFVVIFVRLLMSLSTWARASLMFANGQLASQICKCFVEDVLIQNRLAMKYHVTICLPK